MKERAAAPAPDINSRIARRVPAAHNRHDARRAGREVRCHARCCRCGGGESSPTGGAGEAATGLGIALAGLFDDASAPASLLSRRADRRRRDPQSGYLRRNISPANYSAPAQIVEVILPAGARVAYESGAREVGLHQQLWIQEGAIEVTVGNVTYRLTKDDCLAMQLDEPITFRNRTRKAARYIVVLASERPRTTRR
jgi:hypothetical protein